MKRFKPKASAIVAVAALATLLAFVGSAQAAGGSDYSHAQYQITFSLNCDNPKAPCQQMFGLGGAWGWIALLPDGSANAQVTECGHTVGGGGPGSAGAGHIAFDSTWEVFPSATPPSPVTPTDPNGLYINVDNGVGLPPFPATYGHYNIRIGGATGEITIAP
jgi:hypothetical protein